MCGIVGYVGPREVVPLLLAGLKRLEYRGYDSAGVAVVNGEGLQTARAEGKLEELVEKVARVARCTAASASATPAGPRTAARSSATRTPSSTPGGGWR